MTNNLSPRHTVQTRHWGKALSLPLLLAVLLGPLLGLQAIPAAADGWVIECVDCPKQFSAMTDRSLRLDPRGHPHIAYGEDHLYYAWHDGANWRYETVDDSPAVGTYASLALDEDGYPHISYLDLGNRDLKYAHQDASGWHIETVDSEEGVGTSTCLALDGNGYPHISYLDTDKSALKYACQDASGWHTETVDSEGFVGGSTSLALDENDNPHISYYNAWPNGDLKYAYQDAAGWHIRTVDSEGDVGTSASLVLDRNGYPHISYFDLGNHDLKYAHQDVSGWHIQTVDSEGDVGGYSSLALDRNGYPHISYYVGYDKFDLKYAYQDATGWHIETVVSQGHIGVSTSLALDGGEYPHISYLDETDSDLKYAYYSAPWLNWREPRRPLLLPLPGATVDVVYRNIATPAILTATFSGPATFADGSQVFTADITSSIGSYALHLRPAAGAMPGATFNLEATLAGLHLERTGAIAWGVYLPLIPKVVPTPTPTPTPTPVQPRTIDLWMSDAPGGPERTRFASGTSVVYVVFTYSGMQNEEFAIRIYDNVGNVLFEHVKAYTGWGTESMEVSGPEGGAFPDGRYVTNLYMGLFPIKTIIWEVSEASKTFLPFITPTPTPLPTSTPTITK